MKKLMCVVALMFGMSMATFGSVNSINRAENTNVLVEKYTINANAKSLVRFLELSEDQVQLVIEFQRTFEKSLLSASDMQVKPIREAIVNNAIKYNLRNMRSVLTNEQYQKYLRVLNVSLKYREII